MSSREYIIQGKGPIKLYDQDYITEGGEGKIYGKGSLIYKIYDDLNKMIPIEKIKELQKLNRANILAPIDIVLNKNMIPIGFTMDHIKNTLALCKLFTNDFRNRNNITPEIVLELIENMQETIQFIHEKQALIVDGNELNYLVNDKDFTTPYFIDVNSYQTQNFPATAIMPSIRDYSSNKFTIGSDWYSFAIICCQLFIGIHPFKGKHPNFKKNSLVERMTKGISIFNKEVSVPASTRDFAYIPTKYREWFTELFEKGRRIPPPTIAGMMGAIQITTEIVESTNNFIIKLLKEYKNTIVKVYDYASINKVILTSSEIFLDKLNYLKINDPNNIEIVFTEKYLTPIVATIDSDENLILRKVKDGKNLNSLFKAKKLIVVDNKLFVWSGIKLIEIILTEIGNNILISPGKIYDTMTNSTQIFNGMLYSNLLGKSYIMIPKLTNGSIFFTLIYIKELEKYKIIDAKFDKNVCIMIGYKGGKYERFTMIFDSNDFNKYTCRIDDVDSTTRVNFITLKNNIVINIIDDGEIEIFKNQIGHSQLKLIKDPAISKDMILCNSGLEVQFYKNKSLYSLKMK